MAEERITVILQLHRQKKAVDIDIPLGITAHELIIGLNQGYKLGIDTDNVANCVLRAENPTALLRGNKTLEEYGLRNGTVINII